MKIRTIGLILVYGFAGLTCRQESTEPEPVDFTSGWFETSPQNMNFLNTKYDDYNMTIYYVGQMIDLYYSTNKGSLGNEFDITSRRLEVGVNLDSKLLTFKVSPQEPDFAWKLLRKINTDADEFGPFSFYSDSEVTSSIRWYFFYASNQPGNFDIRVAYINLEDWEGNDPTQQVFGPYDASVLNSESDDFYATIDLRLHKIFFSSNRGQGYDIYEADLGNGDLVTQLQEEAAVPVRNHHFSGSGDDKCPYIKGNLMVFASNRESGYGGYDLWYSVFENGKWGEPKNFGPGINTEFDEYRPAVEYFEYSNNDLMIFSSNRPGGSGGFDLYYTGIPKMTED